MQKEIKITSVLIQRFVEHNDTWDRLQVAYLKRSCWHVLMPCFPLQKRELITRHHWGSSPNGLAS